MTRVLATVLVFEAVVFALAIAGMVQVSAVPTGTAAALGGGAALLALVAAATLRRGAVGFALGWLAQASGVALGAVVAGRPGNIVPAALCALLFHLGAGPVAEGAVTA